MIALLAAVVVLIPGVVVADTWVPLHGKADSSAGAVDITLIESTQTETVIEINVHGVFTSPVDMNGRRYTSVSLGQGYVTDPGTPSVPFVSRMIAVPRGSQPKVEVEHYATVEIDNVAVPPAQVKPKRCGGPFEQQFVCDDGIYKGSGSFPGMLATIEETGVFRDVRYARVRINPVQFDPASNRIVVYTRMKVRIVHKGLTFLKSDKISPVFHSLYMDHVINYAKVAAREGELPAMERIIVITPGKFQTQVADFVSWKRQLGFRVDVVSVEDVGATKEAIKAYLQGEYDDPATRPTYVILVGDIEDMPTNSGTGGCASDFIYSQLDGDDLISDILISRFSVQSGQDLALQIEKVVSYESEIAAGDASNWLSGAVCISSSEGSGASNDDVRSDIICGDQADYGYLPTDKFYNSTGNDTVSNISAAIDQGRGWVTYLGHGSGTSWSTTSPEYSVNHINQLVNVDKLTTVIDVSCSNGGFDVHGSCFAEAWMRANDGGKPTGAVAIYSASTPASWDEPAEMAVGVVKALTKDGVHRWGDLCFSGRAYMMDVLGTGGSVPETCDQYIVFGDASLMVRSRAPSDLSVSGPSVLPVGEIEETFKVTWPDGSPVEEALVHLYMGDAVDIAGYTDASGQVTFVIETKAPGELSLTVSAFDAVPYFGTVDVIVTGCGIIKVAPGLITCDGAVDVTLWDQDLNTDPSNPDKALVTVGSNAGGSVQVTLTETEAASNRFKGTVDPAGAGLTVEHGATLTFGYNDADCEGSTLYVSAQVQMDCEAPVISNVQVPEVYATMARVTWETNEVAFSGILYGKTDTSTPLSSDGAGTEHEVNLEGLQPSTTYSFIVEANDLAGNHGLYDTEVSFTTSDCDPQCEGKSCGPDGCGAFCGMCSDSEWCVDGKCQPDGCGEDPSNTCLNACGGGAISGWCYCDDVCMEYGDCCPDYVACCKSCTPDCTDMECGADGCGGSCGFCAAGLECIDGGCICVPDCLNKECGDDGCNGSCGVCHFGKECVDGTCMCIPDCEWQECGPDGCGGDCGPCVDGWVCEDHVCIEECLPDCAGKQCGDDGCDGLCGECDQGWDCEDGTCVEACIPDCDERECGDDGCDGVCGTCQVDQECIEGKCLHVDEPDCEGKVCGPDGVGGLCGTCPEGTECSQDGTECLCVPSCANKECGADGCGGICGVCPIGKDCQWNGKCVSSSGPDSGADATGADAGGIDSSGRAGGSNCSAGNTPSSGFAPWLLLLAMLGMLGGRRGGVDR